MTFIHKKICPSVQTDKAKRNHNESRHFIIRILILGILIYIFSMFFYQVYFVSGISMSPTLTDKQPVFLQKFNLDHDLNTNDIVVIKAAKVDTTIIKRIIGVPGDQIVIKDGALYVNDSVFPDVTVFPAIEDSGMACEPLVLGYQQYFVLGDNRNQSIDSRFEQIGIIERASIIGKVIFP